MRSPVQLGELKRGELNMDMERDGCLCTGESNNNAPPFTACGIIHTFRIGQMHPPKTQAIILVCEFKHSVGRTKVTKE